MPSSEDISRKSVAALQSALRGVEQPPDGLVEAMASDPRRSVRALAAQWQARASREAEEERRLNRLRRHEDELRAQGFTLIAGVDESGVGPLAGPLAAAAVILPSAYRLRGLDDSKRILDQSRRETLAARIRDESVAWAVGWAEVEEIDRLNVYQAGLLAMRRAVEALSPSPDFLLVDARRIPQCAIAQRGIIHGDRLSASIAAASLIAKTSRDAFMLALDLEYPGYGFASHKGYATPEHCAALERLGPLPVHRRSFRPVQEAIGPGPLFFNDQTAKENGS
jgi:ribonuclease HII